MTRKLKAPMYLTFDRRGRISQILCKGCGCEIAKQTPRGFVRGTNYAELKMGFDDGSFHVTNLCSACVKDASRDAAFCASLHKADMDQMEAEDPQMKQMNYKGRKNPRFIKAELKRRPLL